MTDVAALLVANLHRVFGERDAESRRSAIDELFAADVVFADPDETLVGVDRLDAKAGRLLAGVPEGLEFAEDGPAYVAGDFGALAWRLGPAEAPVVRGIDVITVRDGRITELRTAIAAT